MKVSLYVRTLQNGGDLLLSELTNTQQNNEEQPSSDNK